MTDGEPDERHCHYHGARVVDLVLGLADWWLSLPGQQHVGRRCARSDWRTHPRLPWRS